MSNIFDALQATVASGQPKNWSVPQRTSLPLASLVENVSHLYGRYEAAAADVRALSGDVAKWEAQVQLLTLSEAALSELLGKVSAAGLGSVEQTITYGLRTVFDDHPLSFKFAVSQQRGGQSLEPMLVYGDVEAPILDSFGGGPASIVSFLLRLLVCHQLGLYPVLLLDETFAMVSKQYVPNVAVLLKELAGRMGMTFLMVTHQPGFIAEADRAYEVVEAVDGVSFSLVV